MRKKFYLCLLILFAIISQGIGVLSDENIDDSTDLHIRKKRLVDKSRNGGLPVHLTMAPYIVNILKDGVSHCAGSILDSDVILSSSSCLRVFSYTRFSVLSGSAMKNNGTHHTITQRIFAAPNGLVIFKIIPPINFHESRNARIEVFQGNLPLNAYGIFSGWGSIGLDQRRRLIFPEQLMQTRLPIITQQECIQAQNGLAPISARHLCTLDETRRRATSFGDQGGPLVYDRRLLGVLLYRSMEIGVRPDIFINLNLQNPHQWINAVLNHLRN